MNSLNFLIYFTNKVIESVHSNHVNQDFVNGHDSVNTAKIDF